MDGCFDKVIWAEGIALGQQHFQCWDEYYQKLINLRCGVSAPFCWGVIDLEIDEYALINRQFVVRRCLALLQHGLVIDYVQREGAQLCCDLNGFDAGEKRGIFMVIAKNGYVSEIAGYPELDQSATWQANYKNVTDLYDSRRDREVMFGELNLKIIDDIRNCNDSYLLKVAEVEHVGGKVRIVRDFVPSVVNISASVVLAQQVNDHCALLTSKIELLQQNRNAKSMRELLLVNILIDALMNLRHIAANSELHPRELFLVLAGLISKLSALGSNVTLTHLPEYKHEQLTETFTALQKLLLTMMDEVMPDRQSIVVLERVSKSLYVAKQLDDVALLNCDWFIAVNLVEADELNNLLRQIKVAAPDTIEALTISASSGLAFNCVQHLPDGLPPKVGYSYLSIVRDGDYWDQVRREQGLAIFVPDAVADVVIELVVLKSA